MDKIIKLLNIDETFTKNPRLRKKYNSVKQNIPHKSDYNFMADILMLPETKKEIKIFISSC